MKDFNDYKRQPSKSQADAMDMIKNFDSKYEGASENQLVAEIIKEAEKGRKNGTLTDTDIERFKSMIEPMLSREQRAKLNKIVNTIKKN